MLVRITEIREMKPASYPNHRAYHQASRLYYNSLRDGALEEDNIVVNKTRVPIPQQQSAMAAQVTTQQETRVETTMEKLVQQLSRLRDDVTAGTHPRLKRPPGLANGFVPSANNQSSLPNGVNLQAVASNSLPGASNATIPTLQNGLHANHASMQLATVDSGAMLLQEKRRQLERVLEEQLQQKKLLARQKTCDQEIIADFDVSDVLRKAHELVKPLKPQESKVANRAASSSDSFDENTFYSSQMNSSTTTEEVETSKNWRRPLRICRFFRDGKPCPYGEKCTFSHDPAVLKKIEAAEQDRAGATNHSHTNGQANRKAAISPRPPQKSSAPHAPKQNGVPQDPQIARIAELEEQLRLIKEQQRIKMSIVPRAVERDELDAQNQAIYAPSATDEFGRDRSRREEEVQHPRDTVWSPKSPHIHAVRAAVDSHTVGAQNHVHVVRNHITSPYAPQPARVSPLAVTKAPQVPQLQRAPNQDVSTLRRMDIDNIGTGDIPGTLVQTPSSKKRRRKPDLQEQSRNVVQRREDVGSPVVRIKEEPVSPPPYNFVSDNRLQQSPIYIDTAGARPQERIIYQPESTGRSAQAYEVQDRRAVTPIARRVVSRNGQHYYANEEPDLRRVVSARQMRAPPSPSNYDARYSDPQPHVVRAMSQVQYVSPTERLPPVQYKTSIQPQSRERPQSPQPRQVQMSPTRHTTMAMPPPARRIVVDQFGNRFMEASVPAERSMSVAHPRRQVDLEPQYEQSTPRRTPLRQAEPVIVDEQGRYVHRVETPPSPQFVEYPPVSRKRQVVHLDQDAYEQGPYDEGDRVVRYKPQPVARHPNVEGIREGIIRTQSVQPMEGQYETMPREAVSRVPSVRPQQPRMVSLGDRQEVAPRVIRQVSVRPDDGFARPVQRMQPEPMYQYTPQEEEGRYVGGPPNGGMYEQPGSGGKRYVQRM